MYSTFASMFPGFSKGRWVNNREITLSLDSCCHWLMIPVEGIGKKRKKKRIEKSANRANKEINAPWQGKYDTPKGCLHE